MRKYISFLFISLTTALILSACANQPVYRQSPQTLQTVASVDINRYLGKWYEIYRLPNWFEDTDCITVFAEYALRDDGRLSVLNTTEHFEIRSQATARAVIDAEQNAFILTQQRVSWIVAWNDRQQLNQTRLPRGQGIEIDWVSDNDIRPR